MDDLKSSIHSLGLDDKIPVQEDISPLLEPLPFRAHIMPNRLAIQPMEGCDGTADGRPSELTLRRYRRFGAGGAGLLWFEATAVVSEGRANPRQLVASKETLGSLKQMLDSSLDEATKSTGSRPFTVKQLTHSGRYSKPEPLLGARVPELDNFMKIPDSAELLTDSYLASLPEKYAEAASIAMEAGFDAIDIKACHRYLMSELFGARMRPGRYGGSLENRTRLFMEALDAISSAVGGRIEIATRMNVYDAIQFPYGWGMSDRTEGHPVPDLSEPIDLIRRLYDKGIGLVDVTFGNPYYNPHIGRPFDIGSYLPPEHPLERIATMIELTRQIKEAVPGMTIVATGYSWLRQFAPYVGAAVLKNGWADIIGFGRMAFAYPDFAKDLIETGHMDPKKSCISCSNCTVLMRDGMQAGCPIKDREVYGPILAEGRAGKPSAVSTEVRTHI